MDLTCFSNTSYSHFEKEKAEKQTWSYCGISSDMSVITFIFLSWFMGMVHSHIVMEEKTERTNVGSVVRLPELLPPISIVDLTKTSRRVSRAEAERNKLAKRKVVPKKKTHPPPPSNCVPIHSSCKPPAPPCCEPCAICYCHLFQTVCYYKMGYPHC